MKKYLIFICEDHNVSGGIFDFVGDAVSIEAAKAKAEFKLLENRHLATVGMGLVQIVDYATMTLDCSFNYSISGKEVKLTPSDIHLEARLWN